VLFLIGPKMRTINPPRWSTADTLKYISIIVRTILILTFYLKLQKIIKQNWLMLQFLFVVKRHCSPDTVNIEDILSVDVTSLSSISTSGMDATPCPDMSMAKSVSVDLGTLITVDFDDRTGEIQDIAAMSEFSTDTAGARGFQNPSLAPNVGHANIGESPPWHASTHGTGIYQFG